MTRLALLVTLIASAAVLASPVSAQTVVRETIEIEDVTFPDAFLSAACGTQVLLTVNGTLTLEVVLGAHGRALSEVDTFVGTIEFSAPATGRSLVERTEATSVADYLGGATVRGRAIVSLTGTHAGILAGGPPGSGQLIYNVEVVEIDPSGIPFTVIVGDPLSQRGTFEEATRAVCFALTAVETGDADRRRSRGS